MSETQDVSGELRLTDPRAMRALAHPTRVKILDYLFQHGPATATQCAPIVGESPSDCSFHLRTLGRWGFVEALPPLGRQRPWRPIARQIRWSGAVTDAGEDATASTAPVRGYVRRDEQLLELYLEQAATLSAEWQAAVAIASNTLSLTSAELTELAERYQALIRPYAERSREVPQAGARRVQLVFRTIPAVDEPAHPSE